MSKVTLLDFGSDYQSKQNLNTNNDSIEAGFDNTLSRDGTGPNQMQASLDMNSNRVINTGLPILGSDAVNLNYLASALAGFSPPTPGPVSVSVLNYPALKAYNLSGMLDGSVFFVQGCTTALDGGGGFFRLTSSNPGADDTGTKLWSNTSGKYFQRVFVGPLIDLWFGVKADGSTDNTAALQKSEDVANSLGLGIYYPNQTAARLITGTINTYSGVEHHGDGINTISVAIGTINVGGSTIYKSTGTGSVFSFQAGTGTYTDVPAPSWRDMNIHAAAGSGITLNSVAGGFTDDLTSQASQDHPYIHRVGFNCPTGDHCVALFKCQSAVISECIKMGSVNGFYIYGSDNCVISHNYLELALNGYEINASAAGATFGNMLWIEKNVFETPNTGAIASINSSYRSIYIQENFFEENPGVYSANACIILTAGINATVRNNEVDYPVGGGGNWININGTFANLDFGGNKTGIAPAQSMTFNGGAGHKVYVNGIAPVHITADGPLISGIPFVTSRGDRQLGYQQVPPPVTGAALWRINPNEGILDPTVGPYFSSLMVLPSAFYNLPAAAASANKIGWSVPVFTISDTVDVWVLAYSPVASQTLSITFAGTTVAQALTTTPAWYKLHAAVVASTVATLQADNLDTGHGGSCYIAAIEVRKH